MSSAATALLRASCAPLLRFAGLLLCIVPLFAGFLPVLFDRRRRGLHDMLAGTAVVYGDALRAA